jgi:hypothetical protein
VVYKHDGAPVDGGVFVHKIAAELFRAKQHNALKLEIRKFNLTELMNE